MSLLDFVIRINIFKARVLDVHPYILVNKNFRSLINCNIHNLIYNFNFDMCLISKVKQ